MQPAADIKSIYPKRFRRSFHLKSPKLMVPCYIANRENLDNNGKRRKREPLHILSVNQYQKKRHKHI
jgi:hypothetical protein